jgi:DNA-binding NarL/FixJ family response regulator
MMARTGQGAHGTACRDYSRTMADLEPRDAKSSRPGGGTDRLALRRTLDALLGESPAQCASLSRFDAETRECRIEAVSGHTLVGLGGVMPIECSTNFATAAAGDVFEATDLWASSDYDRGWDLVTVAGGMRATCTIPLLLGRRAVGAVSFSSREPDIAFAGTVDSVVTISDELVLSLIGRRSDGRASRRVIIFVDDELTAEGLARIAERELDAEIVPCSSIEEVGRRIGADTDLVLTDAYTGGLRVDEHAETLRRAGVQPRIVVVSSYDVEGNRAAAARAGALGYVARDVSVPAIGDAVLRVGMGDTAIPSSAEHAVMPESLTRREGEILVLLERGLQVKQIARMLGISETTVKGYQRNVFAKLDVHSTTAAIYAARQSGLLHSLQGIIATPASPDGILMPLS